MTAADFRRIALSLAGAEEGSHMGSADFRVGGRIFATLASQKQGYGNLMLTPEIQTDFVGEQPKVFLPIAGVWGRMGMTHIRLAQANEDVLADALSAAWKLRVEKNTRARPKSKAKRISRQAIEPLAGSLALRQARQQVRVVVLSGQFQRVESFLRARACVGAGL